MQIIQYTKPPERREGVETGAGVSFSLSSPKFFRKEMKDKDGYEEQRLTPRDSVAGGRGPVESRGHRSEK